MGLDFIRSNGGRRLDGDTPQPTRWGQVSESDEEEGWVDLNFEVNSNQWQYIRIDDTVNWRPNVWSESPVRFVDGKDEGQTIAWVRSSDGYPVPVRLSQIGSVVMTLVNGEIRRRFASMERVVSMVVDPFPWGEVEGFAAALQNNGLRLLPAYPANTNDVYEYEKMRRAAQNRTSDEMGVLEEAAIAQDSGIPTIVDGRLEPRAGGFDRDASPVFGVVKTHYRNYLHPFGRQLLYQLNAGQRTPAFSLPKQRLPVVSWYVRLSDDVGTTPDWGFVRLEASLDWFNGNGKGPDFINRLSRVVYEYRCREKSYSRAPVSIHPIVRAEESLGSQFLPGSMIIADFYRKAGL